MINNFAWLPFIDGERLVCNYDGTDPVVGYWYIESKKRYTRKTHLPNSDIQGVLVCPKCKKRQIIE